MENLTKIDEMVGFITENLTKINGWFSGTTIYEKPPPYV